MPAKWEKGCKVPRYRLSHRHRKVLDNYYGVSNFNKTDALRREGYSQPLNQHRIFAHPAVVEEMQRRDRELEKRYDVNHDRLIAELAKVAFSNMYDFGEPDEAGFFKIDLSETSAHEMAAVAQVKVKERSTYNPRTEEEEVVKEVWVKPHSKLQAIDQLMRHGGHSKDKTSEAVADLAGRLTAGLGRLGEDVSSRELKEGETEDGS